nr:MAG TPA: hypothetical protein [Caudoviricetes sp.]
MEEYLLKVRLLAFDNILTKLIYRLYQYVEFLELHKLLIILCLIYLHQKY